MKSFVSRLLTITIAQATANNPTEIPDGNPKDIFDLQAMNMAFVHNLFIRVVNSISYHARRTPADKIPALMQFCILLVRLLPFSETLNATLFID